VEIVNFFIEKFNENMHEYIELMYHYEEYSEDNNISSEKGVLA
jgi:hypothetical protein